MVRVSQSLAQTTHPERRHVGGLKLPQTAQSVPMKPISEERRWMLVTAVNRGATIRQAAQEAQVSLSVAYHWITCYRRTGAVAARKPGGRNKALSTAGARRARELLLSKDHHGAKDVARTLHKEGFTQRQVAVSTVIRAAVEQAKKDGVPIHARRGKPSKQLSQKTKAARLTFAQNNKARDWGGVMFTDRKKFLFKYPGCSVKPVQWLAAGEQMQAGMVNRPMCVNVYAGVTRHGVTKCHVVAGTSKHTSSYVTKKGQAARNITHNEYRDVLRQTLLPQGSELFSSHGMYSWVLQQDNDPTHRAAADVVKQYNRANVSRVQVLANWPPSSPDLSPIENIWSWVEARVHAQGCKTFDEFKQAVFDTMKSVPKSMVSRLYASMPKRMAKVTERGGDKIRY